VTIVEMMDEYAADAPFFHKQSLRLQFGSDIKVELNTRAIEVKSDAVLCLDPEGKERLFEADTVFCAVGMSSRFDAAEALRFCSPRFISIGDCVRPRQITQALSSGHYAALEI